ncbi:MAG TPA: hypothetical protein VI756_21790 [Blastocatellia bacterium]
MVTIAVAGACRITMWLAFGAFPAAWLAWRAFKLSKYKPQEYGGYRVASATLAIVLVAGLSVGIFGVWRIPKYFAKRKIAENATTEAAIMHLAGLAESCKGHSGSYPNNGEALTELTGEGLPVDYWQKEIRYESYAESAAVYGNYTVDKGPSEPGEPTLRDLPSSDDAPGIQFHNFEIRSAGPDGIFGTADDIVMRDGVFCTDPRVVIRHIDRVSPDR